MKEFHHLDIQLWLVQQEPNVVQALPRVSQAHLDRPAEIGVDKAEGMCWCAASRSTLTDRGVWHMQSVGNGQAGCNTNTEQTLGAGHPVGRLVWGTTVVVSNKSGTCTWSDQDLPLSTHCRHSFIHVFTVVCSVSFAVRRMKKPPWIWG